MADLKQPLAEVFGYLIADHTEKADRYRSHRLCPFNNKVPNCTKDKAKDPLGVCSIYYEKHPVITCPIRFREDWTITDDAASFFFKENTAWSSLTKVRLVLNRVNDYFYELTRSIIYKSAFYNSWRNNSKGKSINCIANTFVIFYS